MKQGWPTWLGAALVLALVALVIGETMLSGEVAQDLEVVVTSPTEGLGEGRFHFDQHLTVAASPRKLDEPACLASLDREGRWLGEVRAMEAQGSRWKTTLSAADLSASHFGPVWVVVISGEADCAALRAIEPSTSGSSRPMEALSEVMSQRKIRFGIIQIFIHDKLS